MHKDVILFQWMLKMSSQYHGDMYNQQQLHSIKLFVVISIIRLEQDYKSFRRHLIPSGKEEKADTILQVKTEE